MYRCNTLLAGPLSSLPTGPPNVVGPLQDEAHYLKYVGSLSIEYCLQNHYTDLIRLDSNVLYNSVHLGDKQKLHV